jgi:hypothetical protein
LSFNILNLENIFGVGLPKKLLPLRKDARKEDKIDHNTQLEHIREKEETVSKSKPKSITSFTYAKLSKDVIKHVNVDKHDLKNLTFDISFYEPHYFLWEPKVSGILNLIIQALKYKKIKLLLI